MDFRKSSYSGGSGGDCVEVAAGSAVYVRDTKQDGYADRSVVTFASEAWARFTFAIR
ncbi:MAG: DUF397 domain-containing protein [Streptosporangiales bacterium]|jgi:hypothetical protein|nr:DUF397 domain-containing protein [Streptosporangiales bacterium]